MKFFDNQIVRAKQSIHCLRYIFHLKSCRQLCIKLSINWMIAMTISSMVLFMIIFTLHSTTNRNKYLNMIKLNNDYIQFNSSVLSSLESSNNNVISSLFSAAPVTDSLIDRSYETTEQNDKVTRLNVSSKIEHLNKFVFDRSELETSSNMKIDKPNGCGELQGQDANLLIIIISAIKNFENRLAIRETWAKFAQKSGAYVYFLIGSTDDDLVQTKVENEDNTFHDILQGDFFDSYKNLTLKTMTMMHWVGKKCSKIRYVMKVDDDMVINMQHVIDFSKVSPNSSQVIIGKLAQNWKPIRNKKSKYYLPYDVYKNETFPDFVTGPAYFLTGNTAQILYDIAKYDKSPLLLEDVYMTGIIAEKAGIARFNHSLILNTHQNVTPCKFLKMMTSHHHSAKDILRIWKKVNTVKC